MVSPDQHQSCYIMLALKKFKIFTISNSAYFVFFCERMKLHSREYTVQTTHTHTLKFGISFWRSQKATQCIAQTLKDLAIYGY